MPQKMEDYPLAIRVPVHCGHLFLTTCKFLGHGIFLSMSNGISSISIYIEIEIKKIEKRQKDHISYKLFNKIN